jgi:hypothetical protein
VSERPQGETSYLHKLKAERYSNDGYAEQQSYKKIIYGYNETSQKEPKDIS